MRYQLFSATEHETYPLAILAPKLEQENMAREYLDPHLINPEEVVAYQLHQTGKKTNIKDMRAFLDTLMPVLEDLGSEYIIVGDGDYFKTITGAKKADPYLGYVLPNVYPTHLKGQFNVLYAPNYRRTFYNPGLIRSQIKQSFDALYDHRNGRYREPGCSIIQFSEYPRELSEIKAWLHRLLDMDCDLTCDTETFSLKAHTAGIGTISFAWSKHEGIAFPVDLGPNPKEVRKALVDFFRNYERKMTYHNISFDGGVLISQLYMKDILDTEGLLRGMKQILKNWDCTKIITYLATNSCAGNNLSLKDVAQEFAGNYAVDSITDITAIPMDKLLEYNLVDSLSTWFAKEKHWDTMVGDQQLDLYEELFKPIIHDIIQMQLTGMPLNMERVIEVEELLNHDRSLALQAMQGDKLVAWFTHRMNEEAETARYQDWEQRKADGVKVREYTPGNFQAEFNPNSTAQLQKLIYEDVGLPVLARTKTNQPSTKAEELEKLKAYTEDQDAINLIDAILDFAAVDKIINTFLPPMLDAMLAPDGMHYLFGNFNLGGTVSGRLSSSEPNLQNLPANGKYAGLIKSCFQAPKGWLMVGLDFDSLEDKISALTTKDTNKLKVYVDGYDGHSLRAFSYFPERMSGIVDTVEGINSIKVHYPDLRQESKTPTFLLTYGGTHIGLMAKGFTKEQALEIEERYHELYKESDQWVADRLDEATKVGYITGAFGLRVRTPLLAQVVRGTRATPFEAEAEGRTAGNALGQSWCLLNSRASVEFMRRVREGIYKCSIRPIGQIHDSQYYLIPDDVEIVQYVNKYLVKAVQWQDHPAIRHDIVKLGGGLEIYYPSWDNPISIPNGADRETILDRVAKKLNPKKEEEAA